MADRFGYLEAINELKENWLEDLLIFLGIDIQEINDIGSPLFLEYLANNKIEIINYSSIGALSVSIDNELVGEWAGPELTLKRDGETGELYYEIEIEYWSIIEEDIEVSD